MDNYKNNKSIIRRPFDKKGPKVFRFNLVNLLLVVGFLLIIYFFLSATYKTPLGREVTFDEFVQGIISNKYSQVDIRDDGLAIIYDKYVDSSIISNTDFNFDKIGDTTDVVSSLEEVSVDEFLDKIRSPRDFKELIEIIKGEREIFKVGEIIIGNNFVIIKKENSKGGDLLIKNITEDKFKQVLVDKKINLENITSSIVFLRAAAKPRNISEIEELSKNNKYSDIWILNNVVLARVASEEVGRSFTSLQALNVDLISYLQTKGFDVENGNVEILSVEVPNPLTAIGDLLSIGLIVGIAIFAYLIYRSVQGSGNALMKFGQSKAGLFFGKKPETTFKDVAGVDEAKEELKEVVMFLKSPQKFLKLGARIPKGLLLVGAPGTGKTLLARAIAGEAGVPFFHTSGSEFEEMLVGAGASRVRDLFDKAKKTAPSLVFIDEIDAVARKRGTTIQTSTTEQTLNQILVEMDGFEKNTNVIVIAATNRPDVLDPAILRPGRFDRRVVLDLPDIEGRKEIIKIHAKNKPLAQNVDIDKVSKRTVGFSGADIENMLNEAAIITAKDDREEITYSDIEEAATKVMIGPERKRKRGEVELKMTAYHEAGHAIVAKLSPKADPVHRITIISRGVSLGSTMQLPQEDKLQQTQTELESRLTVLLGGRAAEEIVFQDISGGAASDIEQATSIARKMVKLLGMSKELGLVKYGISNDLQYLGYGYGEQRDYSEETARLIDEEVREIIQSAYKKARKILLDNKAILDKLANILLVKEVVESDEFEKLFEK